MEAAAPDNPSPPPPLAPNGGGCSDTRAWGQHAALLARAFSSSARRGEINKVYASAAAALADMESNKTVLCGGFGLCGVPDTLIDEGAQEARDHGPDGGVEQRGHG